MKLLAAVLLVCLLLATAASAISMSPGSVGAAKTIVAPTTLQVTKNPAVMTPVSIATTQGRGMLKVYSVPAGAAVTVSGAGSASGTIPAKFSLYAGTYTVKVSLAGYQDYTETFTLTNGAIKDINADLRKSLSSVSASNIANAAASATIRPADTRPVTRGTDSPLLQLNLYSVPSGAAVSIGDGNIPGSPYMPNGTTPVTKSFPPGSYQVRFEKGGYATLGTVINLIAGDPPRDFTASLVPFDVNSTVIQMSVSSVPAGARVTLHNNAASSSEDICVTPCNLFYLAPGDYTFTLAKTGYHDWAGVRTLAPGMPLQYINASLTLLNQTVTPTVTATPGNASIYPMSCPDADWTCLTPAGAAQQFGYPNARYGDAPCGYAQENGQTVNKYCFMDVDSGGSLPSRVLAANSIRDGDTIYIVNQTWIGRGIVRKPSGASAAPFQSVFDFFSGILSGSAKPESRLDIVGFNPQPEPPGRIATGAINNPENRLNLVGLNPQPEPPAQDPLVQNAK